MLTDALLKVSDAQAVTATAVSTSCVDLSQNRSIGAGRTVSAQITVQTSAAAAGAATVTFEIISSAASDLSTPTVLAATAPISKDDLTAGRNPIFLDVPPHFLASQATGQRYIGLRYTIVNGPLTAGTFTAFFGEGGDGHDSRTFYPSGFTVA